MRIIIAKIGITILMVALFIFHMSIPLFNLDPIGLALILLAMLPWLLHYFDSIDLPGGLKFNISKLKQLEEKIKENNMLQKAFDHNDIVIDGGSFEEPSFQSITSKDPNLALAGLRIEIEKRLMDIAKKYKIPSHIKGPRNILRQLESDRLIDPEWHNILSELIALLNHATHDRKINNRAYDWAMGFGIDLLKALDGIIIGEK